MDRSHSLSVVIPTYRGAARVSRLLPPVCEAVRACATDFGEVVVVDDGSGELTQRSLVRVVASQRRVFPQIEVRLLSRSENGGQQCATIAGIEAARGEVIITIDDDGHPPSQITRLFLALNGSVRLVYAASTGGTHRGWRRLTTTINNTCFWAFLHKPWGVHVGSYRAFFRSDFARAASRTPTYRYISAMLIALLPSRAITCILYRDISSRDSTAPSRYTIWTLLELFTRLWWNWGPFRAFVRRGNAERGEGGAQCDEGDGLGGWQ